MEFGAHLPQIVWPGATPPTVEVIADYVSAARALGFTAVSANDHLVHRRPWFDSQTGLTLALPHADGMQLATTVGLPVVRGPASFAKTYAQLDHLSGGRVLTAVSAGSSPEDYAVAGVPWEERWKRLDESIPMLRAMWGGEPFEGRFYSSEGLRCEPVPAREGGPPIWIGSWGSERGLQRVAALADGWLASAYNTTPKIFAEAKTSLGSMLSDAGRDPSRFPNSLATMMFSVAEDGSAVEFLTNAAAARLGRSPEEIGERLMFGSPEQLAEKIAAYEQAGLQRMFLWPVDLDPVAQLRRFADRVMPLV
jgi:alkanesulfonate monooxygenase SsuD/methylene tetrahydromethanopterin reductase-like flavin-dependent oxidoreductase (luciferase family)